MPIIRSWRLYRYSQNVAQNFGYGWLYVWCVAVGFESGMRDATCCEYLYTLQLLMMGIMVPETCSANHKLNKRLCSI